MHAISKKQKQILSEKYGVISGVLQGIVLGPTLFNIYIKNIIHIATNHLTLYAENSKLFGAVNHESLQADSDHIQNWTRSWYMSFNTGKSSVIHFGKSNSSFKYTMVNPAVNNIQKLQAVDKERGIGTVVGNQHKFNSNCKKTVSHTNSFLALSPVGLLMFS
ncbi:uncharacterized protein LOC136032397 [Artemia franciscana]|uniref:uncharacterized protein LOC136032397 n=1 Tax=Artemia franciscana TaxID=6661 RepID=UPI0032DAE5B4